MPRIPDHTHKIGFTLLELTLVVIVLGVLVSLALPRMLVMVERARTAEAYRTISMLRPKVESCMQVSQVTPGYSCPDAEKITENMINSYFDYEVHIGGILYPSSGEGEITSYMITATRNSYKNSQNVSGEIWYFYDGDYCGTEFYTYLTTQENPRSDCEGDDPIITF